MRISRYWRSQTLKRPFWQRTQTNVSSPLIVRFWNRLVFWKLRYVTSQTCVWGLQTETQTPSTSFVLNRTDWDIHHQTKGTLSTRKWCWCQVKYHVCFAETRFVHLWVLSAQRNKSCRHATTQSLCLLEGKQWTEWQFVKTRYVTNVVTNISAEGLAPQSQPSVYCLQNFCGSLCSLHT